MPSRNIVRKATITGYANEGNAPIYVDADDNILKMIPAGSGTTEVQIVDASSAQTLTGKTITAPTLTVNVQAITALGTDNATAVAVTAVSMAALSVTGATDTGIKLPAATVGKVFMMKKLTTDTLKVYATGSETINATTDALAIGAIGAVVFCVVAGQWLMASIAS
jgi:hypothetical protein